jgi:thiamine-phosphate pyrophosphorylase
MPTPKTPPQLLLITPTLVADQDFTPTLREALDAAPVSAVVLRLGTSADERALLKTLKPLIAVVQEAGAAALIEGAPDLVGKAGADGLHTLYGESLFDLIPRFRPERIVGAGGLGGRDDAMTAGDAGVDYVLFGEPDTQGEVPLFGDVLERLAWWAGLFVTPCVGFAPDLPSVASVAATGAEFVALSDAVWGHRGGPAAALRSIAPQLAKSEA